MLSVDTNSLIHLPRQSSKNCDLEFANTDILKENYSIDVESKHPTFEIPTPKINRTHGVRSGMDRNIVCCTGTGPCAC